MQFTEENISQLLTEALSDERIKVVYQPKFDTIETTLSGAEALCRWLDENGELVAPDNFVPLLEKTGDVKKLDWFVVEQVCKFLRYLIKKNITPVCISSNFSRRHIEEPDFAEHLEKIVDRYEVPHKYLEVEITESFLQGGGENIINFIKSIREKNFNVAIDDFGSGLSSLSFVKDVPANVIKIDKCLLSSNCESEKERIVLESIFQFAHRLNLKTVTEGVETNEQYGFLKTCDCNMIQGFLFSKPITEDQFLTLCQEPRDAKEFDILENKSVTAATSFLMDAVFQCFPLAIIINLSRNSYYMMTCENFTTNTCPTTGLFDECIVHASKTMVPEDQEAFVKTFCPENQIEYFKKTVTPLSLISRQKGDDGIVRKIKTTNYLVKNNTTSEMIVISLSQVAE